MKYILKKEARNLIDHHGPIVRDDLSFTPDKNCCFELNDKSILILLEPTNRKDLLFKNEDEYWSFIGPLLNKQPHHVLHNFPKTENEFNELLLNCKQQLQTELSIENLEYDFDSVKNIDTRLKNLKKSNRLIYSSLFRLLVPFITLCISHETNATIIFRNQEIQPEPWLQWSNGKEIQIFTDLWDEINENPNKVSLFKVTQGKLHSF